MTDQQRVDSWVDRFFESLPAEIAHHRAETMWRTVGPNGLDLLIGEQLADLGGVRGCLAITTPDEWLRVSEFLEDVLTREPLSKGPHYSGERIILGTLAAELKGYAALADRSHDA